MLKLEEIHFVFNQPTLRPGDILLMNTYHERQRRLMQGCIYDHAAIYIGDAFLVEADGLGVVMNHVYSYAFKEADDGCVLRPQGLTEAQIKKVVDFIRAQFGMEYSTSEARKVLRVKDPETKENSNRTFCSRLVGQAYRSIGVELAENPDYCAPDEFLTSQHLQKVEPSTVPFTADMARTVMNLQKNAGNTVLQEAFQQIGKVYGEDIQTLAQLVLASLRHPELDEEAIRVLETETKLYRDPKDETRESWPWFDDDDEFFGHFPTVSDVMYFLYAQFLHYDKTYLPFYQRNAIEIDILSRIRRDSKMLARVASGAGNVYNEAVRIRKRLAYLMEETQRRYPAEFKAFVEQHFLYDYRFHEPIYDIMPLTIALMEHGITGDMLR